MTYPAYGTQESLYAEFVRAKEKLTFAFTDNGASGWLCKKNGIFGTEKRYWFKLDGSTLSFLNNDTPSGRVVGHIDLAYLKSVGPSSAPTVRLACTPPSLRHARLQLDVDVDLHINPRLCERLLLCCDVVLAGDRSRAGAGVRGGALRAVGGSAGDVPTGGLHQEGAQAVDRHHRAVPTVIAAEAIRTRCCGYCG